MINYYDHPAISQSKLKDLKQSPAHFYAKHLDPDREREKDTAALIFGRLVHTCILEPEKIDCQFFIMPKINRKTNEGKAQYNELLLTHSNKTLIDKEDLDKAQAMRKALFKKKTAQMMLTKTGLIEKEFYYKFNDVDCKMKLDFFIEPCSDFPNGLIIDYKSTLDARIDEFAKSIYNYGYHNQVAWYCAGIKEIYNTKDYPPFLFFAQEKTAPYESIPYGTDNTIFEAGLRENNKLLELYKECISRNEWPGYPDKFEEIGLASWMLNKLDEEI